jgi:hypothetical protein
MKQTRPGYFRMRRNRGQRTVRQIVPRTRSRAAAFPKSGPGSSRMTLGTDGRTVRRMPLGRSFRTVVGGGFAAATLFGRHLSPGMAARGTVPA